MKMYIGTKVVKATPMSRQAYNNYRGWELPDDENGDDEGMLLEYTDGGKSNHPNHEGYISWSPKDVFDKAYSDMRNLTFGGALEFLKKGHKAARSGWNGKGMWLGYVQDTQTMCFEVNGELGEYESHPYIVMKTVEGKIVPWLASQTDMLAEDWVLVS